MIMAYADEFVNVFSQEEDEPEDDVLKSRMMTEWNGTAENENLEIFDLSGAGIESFPALPQNLGHICKLDLSNNDLQSIPEAVVARMLNLVVLDVHSNQLRSLPGSVGCLSKLKTLNVSANLIESLPTTIKNCRSLEELNVNFNKLNQLPEKIGSELQNLKKLSVNSNKLSFLPESITNLINLRVLDARLNCIQALPEDLENLINLQVLNVSQNFHYLKRLPYSVGLLLSLIELDVSYNKIAILPNSIGCLKKLQKLSIEGNPLISPPMEVAEQNLYAIKVYLTDQMNSVEVENKSIPHKKKSWIGKLVKYTGLKGHNRRREEEKLSKEHEEMSEGYIMLNYLTFDSASQKTFSPRNLANNSPFFGLVSTGKSIHS